MTSSKGCARRAATSGCAKRSFRATSRSIEAGVLLDIAIVGAVRKAIAADAVSLETALALANSLAKPEIAERVQAMRERRRAADEVLREALEALA